MNRINNNLLDLLQVLFDEYCTCEEYSTARLTDIATFTNGIAMQKFRPKNKENSMPVIKIREMTNGNFDSNSEVCDLLIDEKFVVYPGDVLFSWSGTLIVDIWFGKKGGLNQHIFKVESKIYPKWFYYMWTKHHLEVFRSIALGKATTMGHIKRSDLEKSVVLIPSKEKLYELDSIFSPIFNLFLKNRKLVNTLSEARDAMIEKLV